MNGRDMEERGMGMGEENDSSEVVRKALIA